MQCRLHDTGPCDSRTDAKGAYNNVDDVILKPENAALCGTTRFKPRKLTRSKTPLVAAPQEQGERPKTHYKPQHSDRECYLIDVHFCLLPLPGHWFMLPVHCQAHSGIAEVSATAVSCS